MNEKTEPEKEYPYIDRPMWLYSRSSDKKILALMQQMHELLEEAQRRSYTVVGTSQDMGTGRSMARMGLQQMMRSVKEGHVRAVLVRDLTRLSHDPAVLIQILEFLQDHDTVLITTDSDLRYELYIPANMHYRKEPFVGNVVLCIVEPCGSNGTERRKMYGDA